MITAKRALVAARDYLTFLMSQSDSMLSVWQAAIVGEPVIVHNTKLQKSFWIVPVERDGKVLGQIDIGPDGRVLGHSYMYHDPNDLSPCPSSVTRISAPEALKLADQILKNYKNAKSSGPVFVHDGPPNRLAWMIEVCVKDCLKSRIFVTPKYVYERKTDKPARIPGRR
jgi:hypothetical protein